MTLLSTADQYLINKFEKTSTGPDYIEKKKNQAQEKFYQILLPTSKNEQYKYTPLTKSINQLIEEQQHTNHTTTLNNQKYSPQIKELQSLDAIYINIVNGILEENFTCQSNHIEILSFKSAYAKYPEFLKTNFNELAQQSNDPFVTLNTALFTEGIFINIPSNITGKTIIIQHINAQHQNFPKPSDSIINGRIFINVQAHSQIDIIQNFTSSYKKQFNNHLTEININPSSTLNHYVIEEANLDAIIVNNLIVKLNNDSSINNFNINLNKHLSRNNIHITVDGHNSSANVYGTYIGTHNNHIDNNIIIAHKQPHSLSNQLYKGILTQQSTAVFNGKIHVHPKAQKINAFQANNNILLSDQANLYTKPELEIYADDVKCSHGATVGQIDQDQTFYLQSRGIPKIEAQNLILTAFMDDITDKIKTLSIKKYLSDILRNKISEINKTNNIETL
jgi:Fe-S cluster assembly protein SufD